MSEYMKICHVLMNHDTVGHDVGLLKLMKLVYISHGFLLTTQGRDPYIGKNRFEAWAVGPVLPELRWAYHYGHGDERSGKKGFRKAVLRDSNGMDDESHRKTINFVARQYGQYSGYKLAETTQNEGTPWQAFYKERPGNIVIPDKRIKSYYDGLVERLNEVSRRREYARALI